MTISEEPVQISEETPSTETVTAEAEEFAGWDYGTEESETAETIVLTDEAFAAAAETETPAAEDLPPVTYAEAEQTFHAGEFPLAAGLFSRYVSDNPENAWGHYMLGLSAWKAGDLDASEAAFQEALALKPAHLKSLVNYGRVLIEMDRDEEARQQLELALAANPGSLEARRVMARVQHNLGLLDEAVASYRQVLSGREDDVYALNNLGLILIQQENFEAALSPLAKASLLRDDIGFIQNNLGIALERTGHYAAAGEAFALAMIAGHDKAQASLARVEVMPVPEGYHPIDLAAVAAGFGTRPQEVDMEVASAVEATIPADETTEKDGSRNR